MNFEELESAWAAQTAAPTRPIDPTELKRVVIPELKRRGRFIGYGIFLCVFFLVVMPLITIGNYNYAAPRNPTWYWFYFGTWMVLMAGYLVFLIRGVQRHGGLLQRGTRSLKDLVAASLASLECEMRDCRAMAWVMPTLVLFQVANFLVQFPIAEFGWRPFALRAAFIVGFTAFVSAFFWRHYRVNLKPDHARQQELLRQLS